MSDTKTEMTLRTNIEAARVIVNTVKTTLGPLGRDKLLVDAGGNTIVTNDGATILREMDVSHPAAKMIIECAKTQEAECYDGTTSSVIVAGQLLANSEGLLNKGLHPNLVCMGYHDAARLAIERLNELGRQPMDMDDSLSAVVKTAITGKTLAADMNHVTLLVKESLDGTTKKPRVICLPGGGLSDSELIQGVVVNKTTVLPLESDYREPTEANVILLNSGMEPAKTDDNVQVQLDMKGYSQLKSSANNDVLQSAKQIIEVLGGKGMVFVRDGVSDSAVAYLKKHNVNVVRRIPESVIQSLSASLGVPVHHSPSEGMSSVQTLIQEKEIDDVKYLFVEGDSPEVNTLVLRGSTRTTLDETERGFDDALGVAALLKEGGDYVWGGGSTYAALAYHLRTEAASVSGRKQMAIEAFADALEIIPATLAENSGHDPLDCILGMRKHLYDDPLMESKAMGPNVEEGGLTDMAVLSVVEPMKLVRQAILSATEVTTAMLKIDDMVAKRAE